MLKCPNMKHSELAMPAGSLQCALYAFKGGADAVYLGMKSFSARKSAVNFSFEDLRKLKQVCLEQNKKFYITLNTLVGNADFPQLIQMLKQLQYLDPDGIIIQDLGIAKLIKDKFPSLKMHASTQLAVHTADAVKELKDLGFERVVLSRELTYDEIASIRKECPDIELKVFIHGALCYGFSGVCMASEQLTGRSANCGACAQICRTWFTCKETKEDKWFFSMKDLKLGQKVQQLQELGIDSLKVEGRMKGPEYVYWCSKYYSLLLQGKTEEDKEVQWAMENAQISFSRETTTGFYSGSDNLVCADYPSHRGIEVGFIQRCLNNKAIINFTRPVAIRDGLLVIYQNKSAGFAIKETDNGRSFISEGETVTVNFPTNEFEKKPEYGTKVLCISRHDMNLPLLNENLPLYKQTENIDVTINNNTINVNGKQYPVTVQMANSLSDLNVIFSKVFSSSDKSYFTLGTLTVNNKSSFEQPFIPMSSLKQIRRDFYQELDGEFENNLKKQEDLTFTQIPSLPKPSELDYVELEPVFYQDISKTVENSAAKTVLLNNIGQVYWAKQHPEYNYVASAFLYVKNSLAYDLLKAELPTLIGRYTTDDIKVPAFISRVCFRHHSLGLPCKGCSKDNTYHLSQNGKNFVVKCRDCITKVYLN